MSCALELVLDQATVGPGEPLRGRVVARAGAASRGRLVVAVALDGETLGAIRGRRVGSLVLREAVEWGPGEVHELPFELVAPRGPLSSKGRAVHVRWSTLVVLEGAWGRVTESPRVPFTLVPREGAAVTLGPTYSTPRSRALWSSIGRWIGFVGCFGAFGLPVLIVIAVALRDVAHASTAFWRTGAWSLGGEHPVQLLPGVLLFSGFSALIFATLYLIVRPLVVRALVGRVRTRVVPSLVHPGEPLEVALDIAPRRTFELGRVEVVLVGHENVLRQGRKAATIVPEEVCRVVLPTDPPRELVAGRTVTIAARTTVPADAPWSFGLDGGEGVEWTVKVELEVLRGPDWVEEVPITVLPPGCRA